MKKLAKSTSFGERCKAFFRMKGVVQPRCGCHACWNHYFLKNPARVAAAVAALHKLSEAAVIRVHGEHYAHEVLAQQKFEQRIGKRHLISDREELVQMRGQKYLKHLRNFLAEHPQIEAQFTQ